eukprot:g1435.t1
MPADAPDEEYWVPCAEQGYRLAKGRHVKTRSEDVFVVTQTGEKVPFAKAREFFREEGTCDDNTALTHLDDANILDNLDRRYAEESIYTYTCNVLLAVNPYKRLPLFSDEMKQSYRGKNYGILPPHPYAVADVSYRNLVCEKKSQSLIISGESGAGKTETAKIVMHYLATVVSRTDTSSASNIQQKVINANPILESFGNAQTLRNVNSSRFGKYNKMFFNPIGSLVGSGISTYLLESSRVCVQNPEERNYHIFYEMLHGMSSADLSAYDLRPDAHYRMLNAGDTTKNSPENDKRKFGEIQEAFRAVGIPDEEIEQIYRVIAALVHLGEFRFQVKPDSEQAEQGAENDGNDPEIELENFDEIIAAELLGFDEANLLSVLQWRTVIVKQRDSFYRVPRTMEQAATTLQALTKTLYKRLFDNIISKINALSCATAQNVNHIGILDIYGFERLTLNSFEQLCINLANERLQQFFIENVLLAEQSIYAKEGLQWSELDMPNSWPVVNCVKGVLTILDDHSFKKIKNLDTTDDKFTSAVHDKYAKSGNAKSDDVILSKPKLQASKRGGGEQKRLLDGFVIKHYAGEVMYSTKNWFDKNNDRLSWELEGLIRESKVPLVQALIPAGEEVNKASAEAGSTTGNGTTNQKSQAVDKFVSVGKSYMENLESLCKKTLEANTLHYIRCFNPNGQQRREFFDKKYVLEQVLQSGTVELVHLMHDGFPHRVTFDELRSRFLTLLPEDFQQYDRRTFVESIMKAFEIDPNEWELGVSKLFLKSGQLRTLESLKESGSGASKEVLSRLRREIVRKKIKRVKHAMLLALWMPKFIRQIRRDKLVASLRSSCFILVRLYRWLDHSRGIIRRRFLEEQRRKQQRQLSEEGDLGLHFSKPKSFVCKSLHNHKENLIFTNGKSLYCCVHGERTVGPIHQVNIFTGKIYNPAVDDGAESSSGGPGSFTSGGSSSSSSSASGGGTENKKQQPFPDVCAITQHPKFAFRFAIADVEGRIWFVDWHGIRDESPHDSLLYSVSSVFHGMSHCQAPRALIKEKAREERNREQTGGSSGSRSGASRAGNEKKGGRGGAAAGGGDEQLFLQEVALVRHLAYLPYDVTKRNVVVALIETTVLNNFRLENYYY